MPRAIWTGAIGFGLVTVPVKLYSALDRKTVRFHQLSGKTGVRVMQKRVDPQTGAEVPYEEIVKGYEIAPERYVVIAPGELETLQPKKSKTIEIEDFVELSQIDPIFYEHPYYLAPGTGGAKPYRLLFEAMQQQRLPEFSELGEVKTTKRELDVAKQLVDSLASDFDPDAYRDSYREEVLALIERKAQGEEIAVQPTAEETAAPAPDLMSALKASLDAVRARTDEPAGGGSKPRKAPAKRAAAKKAPARKPASGAKKPAAKKPAAQRAAAKR
jgi:DNA end-binding protein Ku